MRSVLFGVKISALALFTSLAPLHAGTCRGEDPCKHCVNCRSCKYCTSGKGSCSVLRAESDRRYLERKRRTEAVATPAPANPRR